MRKDYFLPVGEAKIHLKKCGTFESSIIIFSGELC